MSTYAPHFIIDENILEINPSRPRIEQWLTYQEKHMEPDGSGDFVTKRERKKLYWVVQENPRIIRTWQGVWSYLVGKCHECGWEPQLVDMRLAFPEPKWDRIHGLRQLQEPFLRHGLSAGWSGVFSAPTRFGKSYCMANVLRAYPGVKTAVLVPGEDLGCQLYTDLTNLVDRDFKLLGFGRATTPSDDVTVCSIDSTHLLDRDTRLVMIDEVHTLVTDKRLKSFDRFIRARKFGFGATHSGRFDNRDLVVEGAVGPVLSEVTYIEARDAGMISPITVIMLRMPYDTGRVSSFRRAYAYSDLFWKNDTMGRWIAWMCNVAIPQEWQVLAFIDNEKAAEFFARHIGRPVIAMAKRLTKKERQTVTNQMATADIKRCLATNIYSTGVTFPDLRVVINTTGGGANTYAVQKPGRVCQVRPGKKCGILVDFLFQGWGAGVKRAWAPTSEAQSRMKLYQEKGYNIVIVNNGEEFINALNACM